MDSGLQIGDLITLRSPKWEAYLSTEGILFDGQVVSNRISEIDDSLFCVHLQRQYSAAQELERFLTRNSINEYDLENDDDTDENLKKYMAALQRGNQNEITLNDAYLKEKTGTPVHFGDVIQLFHVKSRKYLVVDPNALANSERENSRLALNVRGNSYGWIKFLPRSRIDHEGDRIISGGDCYISFADRSGQFVHVADASPKDGFDREVNCSLEKTSWRISIYQNAFDALNASVLLSSMLVYINDPETQSNLTVASRQLESLDDEEEVGGKKEEKEEAENKEGEDNNNSNNNQDSKPSSPSKRNHSYFHDEGDVITRPQVEGKEDPTCIWLMETRSLVNGGPIQWKTEQVRFRNLVSGRYLALVSKKVVKDELGFFANGGDFPGLAPPEDKAATPGLVGDSENDAAAKVAEEGFYVTTVDEKSLITPSVVSSFFCSEVSSSSNLLSRSKALTIRSGSGGEYLARGDELEGDEFAVRCVETREESLNLLINVYVPLSEVGLAEDAPKSLEPLDVHCGLAGRRHLAHFSDMTVIPKNANIGTLWPTAGREDMGFFMKMTAQVMNFSQGFDLSNTHVSLGVDKSDQGVKLRRQTLLRDLGVLEVVIRLVDKLTPFSATGENKQHFSDAATEMGMQILEQCFKIIKYCVEDNAEVQIYVATFLKVLLLHLSTQKVAGQCVTEMLSKNMELQETKIGEEEIGIFVDSLRNSTMNSMYLNLLQCCCSCEGQGVDGNQCNVAIVLFDNAADVLLYLNVDPDKRSLSIWGGGGDSDADTIFLRDLQKPHESIVCGKDVYQKGLPSLSLTWKSDHEEWTPRALWGTEMVPFHSVFSVGSNFKAPGVPTLQRTNSGSADGGSGAASRKAAVAKYFVEELMLGAEMCMDRNYVAMHKLDPFFSFDSLLTILKMGDDVTDRVKAGAARILLCLHIDRDPQAETKIPILTRTWSSIEKHSVPTLPFVEPGRQNAYLLVQHLIAEHLEAMAGRKWNSYSKYMLQMLLSLIKFNFYGTLERMKDTIKPVITAIDRRNVAIDAAQSSGSSAWFPSASTKMIQESEKVSTVVEEKKDEQPQEPWQRIVLDFFESIPVMCFILVLVVIAVSIVIWEVIENIDEPDGSPIYIWGLVVFAIFVIDYSTRFYCTMWLKGLRKAFIPFVTEPFNIIDITVILLDLVFLCLPQNGASDSLTKTLRLLRLARLLRVARAVKIVSVAMDDSKKKKAKPWAMPQRYLKCPKDDLNTIQQSLDVLLFIQGVIDDRNLSLLLRQFYTWAINTSSGSSKLAPKELMDQLVEDAQELTLGVADFDQILLDTVMYLDPNLVQSALDTIVAHNSLRHTLLDNASKIQLLITPKREEQFKVIESMLQELERNAETHELWGELENEAHYVQNRRTKHILVELTKMCRSRSFLLEIGRDFNPEVEIQNLYRNLGCFTICFKMLGLMESVEEDDEGNLSEVALNTRELCRMTNELLYWFFLDNPQNQELGFGELEFFLDTLEAEIKSHHVVRSIFKNNEALMNIVPISLLNDLGEKMETNKSHVFFSLLSSITNVGDKNMVKNQFEIVKALTSPDRYYKITYCLGPISHPDYAEKRRMMRESKELQDPDLDDLPPLLAYHLALLETLCSCTVGRLSITSVEAKIQSLFGVIDIVASILDQDTNLVTRLYTTQFLLNAIVDVEMVVPGLCQSASIWNLLESFLEVLEYARDDLRLVEKVGWEAPQVSRHKIEHILTCIQFCHQFFSKNYEASKVKSDDGISGVDTVKWPMKQIDGIIVGLFRMVKDVYDLDSPRISVAHKAMIYDAMMALNNAALQPVIAGEIEATHLTRVDGEEEEQDADTQRERHVLSKFSEFLEAFKSNEEIQEDVRLENCHFIDVLESLPSSSDLSIKSDLRYEAVIQKLVRSVYDNFTFSNGEKKINARCTATSIWLIKVFRTMIEQKMGMSIFERDEDGGEEQDVAAEGTVKALSENGAVVLCLDLIATGINETLQNEAIKLLVGMLFKEGGARDVQGMVWSYLTKTDSTMFFKQVCATIRKLQSWHDWNGVVTLEEGQEPEPPEDILIIRFLQLLSEGHYLPNQDVMREQPNNHVNNNILDELVNYLNTLSQIPCRTSTTCAIRVAATILEVIQGPSSGNQLHLAVKTELLEVMNRLMHANMVNDCVEEEEVELKMIVIDIYSGLLEGQGEGSKVVERLLSVIHMDVIATFAKPYKPQPVQDGQEPEEPPSEEMLSLKTECCVLLYTLCDFRPELRTELKLKEEDQDPNTVSIEISWDGVLNRRFFHVPEIAHLLAKSSKDELVENVDRSNSENKLIDFLGRAKDLWKEVNHQKYLVDLGVSAVFSRENQARVSWVSFIICIIINALYLNYYYIDWDPKSPTYNSPIMTELGTTVINAMNIIQMATAAFSVLINFVVRSPVIAWRHQDDGHEQWRVILYTALDAWTVYYLWYLLFSILGYALDNQYILYLLLDLVAKNSTTRDILNAVLFPIKQLAIALVLMVMMVYIFTYFTFAYYPTAVQNNNSFGSYYNACDTLWGCFKYIFVYGYRQGGGVGDIMIPDIGNMMIQHILFFLIITISMLNIVFGIIIDTFSSLRADKNERIRDTTEVCFICGKGKQVFDRALNSPDGFKLHVKNDHNMWAYLNFIFFVWQQDKDDDDGLEYYVRHKIDKNEITWFPMNKAMRLEQGDSDIETLRKSILEDIKSTEKSVFSRIQIMQADVDGFLDKFTAAMKADLSSYNSVKKGISAFLKNLDDIQEAAAVTEVAPQVNIEGSVGGGSSVAEDGDEGSAAPKAEGEQDDNEPSAETKDGKDDNEGSELQD